MILTIYGTPDCPACDKAKSQVIEAGQVFSFINLYEDSRASFMFSQKSFNRVPQVFNGQEHIGGLTELDTFLQNNQ